MQPRCSITLYEESRCHQEVLEMRGHLFDSPPPHVPKYSIAE